MKRILFLLGLLMLALFFGGCSPNTGTETTGKAENAKAESEKSRRLNRIKYWMKGF